MVVAVIGVVIVLRLMGVLLQVVVCCVSDRGRGSDDGSGSCSGLQW